MTDVKHNIYRSIFKQKLEVNILEEKEIMSFKDEDGNKVDFEAVARLSEEIKALSDKQREDIHVIKSGSDLDADDRECCQSCSYHIGGKCQNNKSAYYNSYIDGNSRCVFYKRNSSDKQRKDKYVIKRESTIVWRCCQFCLHYDGSRCKNIKSRYYDLFREKSSKCWYYEPK